MKKEELQKQLEYINDVLADMKPNDEDRSFYIYQRDEIKAELELIDSERQD